MRGGRQGPVGAACSRPRSCGRGQRSGKVDTGIVISTVGPHRCARSSSREPLLPSSSSRPASPQTAGRARSAPSNSARPIRNFANAEPATSPTCRLAPSIGEPIGRMRVDTASGTGGVTPCERFPLRALRRPPFSLRPAAIPLASRRCSAALRASGPRPSPGATPSSAARSAPAATSPFASSTRVPAAAEAAHTRIQIQPHGAAPAGGGVFLRAEAATRIPREVRCSRRS